MLTFPPDHIADQQDKTYYKMCNCCLLWTEHTSQHFRYTHGRSVSLWKYTSIYKLPHSAYFTVLTCAFSCAASFHSFIFNWPGHIQLVMLCPCNCSPDVFSLWLSIWCSSCWTFLWFLRWVFLTGLEEGCVVVVRAVMLLLLLLLLLFLVLLLLLLLVVLLLLLPFISPMMYRSPTNSRAAFVSSDSSSSLPSTSITNKL